MLNYKVIILILLFPIFLFARPIEIAIIDTGLDDLKDVKLCPDGLKDFTSSGTKSEFSGHGNNITHIITDGLKDKDYCIYHLKAFSLRLKKQAVFLEAMAYAISKGVDIINFSAGGVTPLIWEEAIISLATIKDIMFITAAGNESTNLNNNCNYFPACYKIKNLVVVGNLYNRSSNYGNKIVTTWHNGNNVAAGGTIMSGTSQATALETLATALKLLKEKK